MQDRLHHTSRLPFHPRQRGLRQFPCPLADTHRLHPQRVAHQERRTLQCVCPRRRAITNHQPLPQQRLLLLQQQLRLVSRRYVQCGRKGTTALPVGGRFDTRSPQQEVHRKHRSTIPQKHARTTHRQRKAPSSDHPLQRQESPYTSEHHPAQSPSSPASGV